MSARFAAKDMHTRKRVEIEKAVQEKMRTVLDSRGFEIEAVLLKSIRLPDRLAKSIEQRLQAEQESERMLFVLEQAKRKQREKIDAEGERTANEIITKGLSKPIISYLKIQAFRELAKSQNSKVIVTDGKGEFLIQGN